MKKRNKVINTTLDVETLNFLNEVAKLSGRTVHDVVNVLLACELVKIERAMKLEGQPRLEVKPKKKRAKKV